MVIEEVDTPETYDAAFTVVNKVRTVYVCVYFNLRRVCVCVLHTLFSWGRSIQSLSNQLTL